ncbi:MFS transporter [Candidatus Viridilinea mediisalina]|uniref:MFS transporter n=1 Tax=Candidatus Viridilinea mediisalina TaxID=2024553 RepID=A0A2A6RJQ1_9CHLR|nr:MFS transporter [Candidatus Viridilinea mediisalina]PDW03173.1 MFS transporter [Candidatus Viridilinea mediisalina]
MQAAEPGVLDVQARRGVMTVLFVGVFMAALDSAVIAPAVPALKETFEVGNSQIGMLTIIFSIFTLMSTTLMASLGDRYGRRPVFLANILGFGLGSLLIALAPNYWWLLVGRAVQGFSSGGVTPIASAMIGDAFPPEERGKALGLFGATFGMAFLLGPFVAALILVFLSWHWIFLLNIPVAVLVFWMGLSRLPAKQRVENVAPLDWGGIILVTLVLTGLVLGINRVLDEALGLLLWPWLLLVAGGGLVGLIAVERQAVMPVVPLNLFAERQLALTYTLCAGSGFGMGSVLFIATVAVEGVGAPADRAGLLLIPLVLASTAGSVIFGQLLNRLGARLVMLIGFGTLSIGSALLALTGMGPGLWIFMPASMLIGLGVGIVVGGTLRTIVLNRVAPEQRGTAQGLVNVGISVGNLLVVAVLGALADAWGGGMQGLMVAYLASALMMAGMFVLSLGLEREGEVQREREGEVQRV